MNLGDQYERQYQWRHWRLAYENLPRVRGAAVLDLGCGVGDQARDLALLGATVRGVDSNPDFIRSAADRGIEGAAFQLGDVRQLRDLGRFDGIWASFVAAYFPDFQPVLAHWCERLVPGGWIAVTEVDGLFEHAPLRSETRQFLEDYAAEALGAERYDFSMGKKLASHMAAVGLEVIQERVLPDEELSFTGAAGDAVMAAWTQRLDRMRLLRERAGERYAQLRADLLACLADAGHVSSCRVNFCVGVKK